MKKLLTTFFVVALVLGGTLALAQTTTNTILEESVPDTDVRFSEFVGAADIKLEAMVGIVVDLFETGLTKTEIAERIRARRGAISSGDITDDFARFRARNINLRRGASGEEVSTIQRIINGLGLGIGTIAEDGRFGPGTESAIRAFQRFVGLSEDGVIGPRTRLKFEEKLGEVKLKFKSEDGKFEFEIKSDDDDSDELEIEVEIDGVVSKVKIEYTDGTEEEFTVNSADNSAIIEAIVAQTDLTKAEVSAAIEFETDDDDSDDDDDDSSTNSGSGNSN